MCVQYSFTNCTLASPLLVLLTLDRDIHSTIPNTCSSQQDSCYLSPTVAGASILQTPHSNSLSAHTYSLLIYSAAKVPICGCTIHPAPSIFPTVPKTYPPVESPFYFVCTAADSAVFKDQQGQLWSIRFPSSAHLEAFVKCILIAQVLLAKDNEDLLLLLGDKQRARKSGSSFFTQVQDLLPVGDNSRVSSTNPFRIYSQMTYSLIHYRPLHLGTQCPSI